ncbi:phage tail protein [Pectobacterium odoriferum]|uniref:phage tail protein n=1 Tax=Pectobacterium odoriferum TaxID=78398 RepID=UPI00215641C4|nr:phage tail protein [Pectobacterium odoriferum]
MSATYFALLTNIGAAKLANATALGSRLNITRMAVGDGGGVLPTPNPAQTKLINEKRRAALNNLSIDPKNPSQIIAEQVIPENEGGWWVREVGLFDDDGNLIAVANCPETYKPLLQQGSGRIQTVRMILIVSSTDAVTLKIDPAVVLATRGYVDDALAEHEKSRKHPDGTLTAKGFVQLSSATNSDSDVLAATPKAVKAVNDNANGRVPSGRKVNGKALTADITLGAGDVGAYTKLETDTAVSVATTAANTAATAAANANTNANGRVPSGRTVNGKALSADIALGAGDVGAYTKAETDTRVAAATTAANNAATAATNANTNANGRVPSGRTVNGKALSADIVLGAGDVGALTDTQAAQKYALRSIKINGKPLSADVNLLAGDIDTWNKTESDGRFLMKSATAAAATRLANPRKINGVVFDGTADINLTPENLGFGEVWFSEQRRMILNEQIIIEHRISELNVDSCVTDVMIVCVADSENYKAGDVLMCPAGLISIAGASRYLPLTAGISTTHIQFNVPNRGLFGCDKLSGGGIVIGTQNEMNNWVAVLKIIKF